MSPQRAQMLEEDGCLMRVLHLERVAQAKADALSENTLERLASTYKVLGDPTRLKMAIALKEGEMCVCDLAALLGLSESAVSHQMRRLKDLNLVRNRRDGQILYYTLKDPHIVELINLGLEHIKE